VTNSTLGEVRIHESGSSDHLSIQRIAHLSVYCTVAELACTQPLGVAELKVGERYGLYVSVEHAILPYMLVSVDLDVNMYTFRSLTHEIESIQVHGSCLPSVYPVGSEYRAHTGVVALVVECVKKNAQGKHTRDHLNMEHVKDKKFILDVGHCHVIEATGLVRVGVRRVGLLQYKISNYSSSITENRMTRMSTYLPQHSSHTLYAAYKA
jgi:hypothetical protein